MIREIDHFSFTVSDLGRSISFYQDILGMRLVKKFRAEGSYTEKVSGYPGAKLEIAYLEIPGQRSRLELIEYLHPKGNVVDLNTNNTGIAHICFYVTNINQMYTELKKKQVNFKSKPVEYLDGPDKGNHIVYLTDPDGITIEFIQPPSEENNVGFSKS